MPAEVFSSKASSSAEEASRNTESELRSGKRYEVRISVFFFLLVSQLVFPYSGPIAEDLSSLPNRPEVSRGSPPAAAADDKYIQIR